MSSSTSPTTATFLRSTYFMNQPLVVEDDLLSRSVLDLSLSISMSNKAFSAQYDGQTDPTCTTPQSRSRHRRDSEASNDFEPCTEIGAYQHLQHGGIVEKSIELSTERPASKLENNDLTPRPRRVQPMYHPYQRRRQVSNAFIPDLQYTPSASPREASLTSSIPPSCSSEQSEIESDGNDEAPPSTTSPTLKSSSSTICDSTAEINRFSFAVNGRTSWEYVRSVTDLQWPLIPIGYSSPEMRSSHPSSLPDSIDSDSDVIGYGNKTTRDITSHLGQSTRNTTFDDILGPVKEQHRGFFRRLLCRKG